MLKVSVALGMTGKEATGEETNAATALFDPCDLARMQQTVEFRKVVADLSDKMGAKEPKKPFKKNEGAWQNFKQGRDGSETGDRTRTDCQAEKEESSEKSTKCARSTPATKKGNARGKGK